MKTIIIKTQIELDALPDRLDDFTRIEIRSSETIYVKKAYGNSSVVAYGNSSVVAWGNSSVELFISAYVMVLSSSVNVKKLLDHSTAVFKGVPIKILEQSETAQAREIPGNINPSFDEWLRRGYVYADNIYKKLKSQKHLGDITIFKCEDFPKKSISFVVKKGDLFSHGETIEKAIEDLRYKTSDRDKSEFEHWRKDLNQEISLDDAIAAYRAITGACEMGVKEFVNSIELPDKLTPNVVIKLTKNKYGNEAFVKYLT